MNNRCFIFEVIFWIGDQRAREESELGAVFLNLDVDDWKVVFVDPTTAGPFESFS